MNKQRIDLMVPALVLILAVVLVLSSCDVATVEVSGSRDDGPADTEVAVPRPETGMVPAAEDEEAPQETPAEAPPPPSPAPAAPSPAPAAAPGEPEAPQEPEDMPDSADYVCYDGLYYVDYDPHDFTPGPAGGADLVKNDGTEIFFARLDSPELTETWLAGMEEKGLYQVYQSYEGHSEQAAGYPVTAIVYQDETAWHAEAVVELDEDRGTGDLPMYAIYLTAHGPSREAVWTDGVKTFLGTLQLGAPKQ